MSNSIIGPTSKPLCRREDALEVLSRLRGAGHVAYFAGGCVRDMLLGNEPKDWDVASDARPEVVRKLFARTQAVGAAFGVVLVHQGASTIEVATFRADLEYLDGRRPEGVRFATPEEDARRRDFTVNGLFLDPLHGDEVIDFVDGRGDLRGRVIRAIGDADARFREDHLRLLRAVRFAARLDFSIEPATETAIRRHAAHLARIAPERIGEELRLMLIPPTRAPAFALLRSLGLLDVLTRFLEPTSPDSGKGEPPGLFAALASDRPISFGLALAGMMLDQRLYASPPGGADVMQFLSADEVKRAANAARQALRISNDEYDAMIRAMSFGPLLRADAPTVAMLKRFLAGDIAGEARALMDAVSRSGLLRNRIDSIQKQLRELEQTDVAPPPLVTGDDLTAFGYAPGPAFKQVLEAVYDAQLEGRVRSKAEAAELADQLMRKAVRSRPSSE